MGEEGVQPAALQPEPAEQERFDQDRGQLWEVIGGWGKDGILVREAKELSSREMPPRLATGALVRELEREDDRMRFELLRGEGPETGWVSVEHKRRMLLVPITSALLLVHGATSRGLHFLENIDQLCGNAFEMEMHIAGITIIAPDSPVVPYTMWKNKRTEVWFDRVAMTYEAPEDVKGVMRSLNQLDGEIDKIVGWGIPPERIFVAGMSMGGCMTLHIMYGAGRWAGKLKAAACLCSFLPKESYVDELAAKRFKSPDAKPCPPIYMAHGGADSIVSHEWGEWTRLRLKKAGVAVPDQLEIFADLEHMMSQVMVNHMVHFIVEHIGGCRTVIYKYADSPKKAHTFKLACSVNDFKEFLPLSQDPVYRGVFKTEVTLVRNNYAWFQIVVDEDWKKTLYPKTKDAGSGQGFLQGPDDRGHGLNWQIAGRSGDTYEVVLDTKQEDKQKFVTWTLRHRTATSKAASIKDKPAPTAYLRSTQ